jgi:multisubunit Na+/H+ antiporter MnhF subunit
VNAWLWAATLLVVGALGPCLAVCARTGRMDALVGLQTASASTCLILLVLVQGLERSVYGTLALVLAVLSFSGTLLFVRLLPKAP